MLFPTYNVTVTWTENGVPPWPNWAAGPGRRKNRTCRTSPLAYQERPPKEKVLYDAWQWWEEVKGKFGPRIADVDINIGPERMTPWIEDWFSHWTWPMGRDEPALWASFSDYVNSIAYREEGWQGRLMGAEDRFRWKFCACEHCTKQGIVRFDH